jgi:6-phosphogluconolactonase
VFTGTVKSLQRVATVGCFVLAVFFQICGMSAEANSKLLYIGTYTGKKSQGIYSARFDSDTGRLSAPELAVETKNPTFLTLHPNGRILYAVSEIENFQGMKTGAISAFSIDGKTERLSLLNQEPSGGGGPCHLSIDKAGKCILVANYGTGSFATLAVQGDGKLEASREMIRFDGSSVNRERQSGPHAHFIEFDPSNKFALGCDLGLDKVFIWQFDLAGLPESALKLKYPTPIKAGSGPRHLAFHPDGRFVYLINEMAATITAFAYDPNKPALNELQTISMLPEKFEGFKSGSEIQVHPSGKFLYGSNRGHNSIAVFSVDEKNGKLKFVEHQGTQGKTPRHFAIDPTGKWLLAENQDSDNIVIFRIDQQTGKLLATGDKIEVGSPVCIQFVAGSAQ